MRYHPHRQLFEQLAATASLLPCTLRIRKVTSHTGIKYNEAADATASDPPPGSPDPLEDMGFRRGPTTTFEHACTSPQGWLLRLHTARWPMPSSTSNLHGSGVPGHIESFNGTSIALTKPAHAFAITTYCHIQHLSKTPRVISIMELGRFTITTTTTKWPNLMADSPLWTDSVTDPERRQWLKGTYGRFFCNNSPGHPLYSSDNPNMCHVCKAAPTSFTHVHLECSHKLIHSLICDRHNSIVNTLATAIQRGKRGGYLTRSDAGATTPTPHTERWTIHPSLTPSIPNLMPDIVQYVNIHRPDEILSTPPQPIHMLEYAFAHNRDSRIIEKTAKYTPLVNALSISGHLTTLSLICSDVRVPLTHKDTHTLHLLGVEGENLRKTRRAIWLDTIKYMHKLTINWRQLEAAAAHTHHPRARGGHVRIPPWGTSARPSSYSHMTRGRPPD